MNSNLATEIWGEQHSETIVLVHGSFSTNPAGTWLQQQELSENYHMVIPSRHGYGESSQSKDADSLEEDARGVVALLGTGAHLVGFSYGGFVSAVAAGCQPGLVKSLAIIEPPMFSLGRGNPAVEQLIEALEPVYARRNEMSPDEFSAAFFSALGQQIEGTPILPAEERQAAAAAMREAIPWKRELPLQELLAASFPKLVISGGWNYMNEVVCDVLAQKIGADRIIISGKGHGVQRTGVPFNEALKKLWEKSNAMA